MSNTQAILIRNKCPKCGETHETIIPIQKINKYLHKKENRTENN